MYLQKLVAIGLWLSVSLALFIKRPLTPSKDPFYEVPDDVSDYELGEIINWRPTPVPVRMIYFRWNIKNAWQLLVRSEDSFGRPTAFVTTILEPYNADPSKVLSYQTFEDSASIDCSPSYSLLYGASMTTVRLQIEMAIVNVGLSKNWYVAIPDYEGPKSAFGAGYQSGKATIDGIRAALNSSHITGIAKDAKAGLFGYSGGTIACGWAAQLQPKYAPELTKRIVGAAFGGFLTNFTDTAIALDRTSAVGIVVAALNGMLQEYPHLEPVFNKEIDSDRLEDFYKAKHLCLLQQPKAYGYSNLFTCEDPWMPKGEAFFDVPELNQVITNNTVAMDKKHGVPQIPLFIFQGEKDEVVDLRQPQRAYDNWCAWGAPSIEFATSQSTGHVLEGVTGFGAAFAWLVRMWDGESPVQGCHQTSRQTNLLYPGADGYYRQALKSLHRSFFGQPIGAFRQADQSTILSKVLARAFSGMISLRRPKNKKLCPEDVKLFKGIGDVVDLLKAHKMMPKVPQNETV